MSELYKIPVTKEQFEQTVQRWIDIYRLMWSNIRCGFCEARHEAKCTCEACGLHPKICSMDTYDSVFDRYCEATSKYEVQQAALEMLEGLYDYGVAHGFIDPCTNCALGIDGVCVCGE